MSSNSFKMVMEIDGANVENINAALRRLAQKDATKAIKNGFREWTRVTKKSVIALAPRGRSSKTERVRGEVRPNPHLKANLTTQVKGYSKGQLVWAAIGIKEQKGTYNTPHWYARWVEFGHVLKRRATKEEELRNLTRGNVKKKERTVTVIGFVPGKHFIAKAYAINEIRLMPIMEEHIARMVAKGLN